jgi:hypothetical protein
LAEEGEADDDRALLALLRRAVHERHDVLDLGSEPRWARGIIARPAIEERAAEDEVPLFVLRVQG